MYRVIVADDHVAILETVLQVIGKTVDMTVVATAADGARAVRLARDVPADLLLLDMSMPGIDGLAVVRIVARDKPTLKVLPYSGYSEPVLVEAALESGAAGYLLKDESLEAIPMAMRKILEGGSYLSPGVVSGLSLVRRGAIRKLITPRRRAILTKVAMGQSDEEIAEAECLAWTTVRNYVLSMISELHLQGRPQLVAWAWLNGFGSSGPLRASGDHVPAAD